MTFQLIKEYRSHRLLWDPNYKDYSDRIKRAESWEEVAQEMGMDSLTVQKKMKSLTTQLLNVHKDYLNRRSFNPELKPKWFAYNALQFFLHRRQYHNDSGTDGDDADGSLVKDEPTERVSSLYVKDARCDVEMNVGEVSSNNEETQNPNNSTNNIPMAMTSPPFNQNSASCSGKPSKRKYHEIGSNSSSSSSQMDDCAIFCDYLAHRLRRINDPKTRLIVQNKISNIVFEAEMNRLQSAQIPQPGEPNPNRVQVIRDARSASDGSACSTIYFPSTSFQGRMSGE